MDQEKKHSPKRTPIAHWSCTATVKCTQVDVRGWSTPVFSGGYGTTSHLPKSPIFQASFPPINGHSQLDAASIVLAQSAGLFKRASEYTARIHTGGSACYPPIVTSLRFLRVGWASAFHVMMAPRAAAVCCSHGTRQSEILARVFRVIMAFLSVFVIRLGILEPHENI